MQNDLKDIGKRIKEIIKKLNISIKEFSDITGIPYPTLQDYIAGKRQPGANNLQKISMRLHISIDWLLTGEGEMFKEDKKTKIKKELYGDILKDAGYDINDPDMKLILEELSRSPSAKKLLAKLIRAKRGDSKSLSEISLILEGLKMAHE